MIQAINEHHLAPGEGFGEHSHRDVEIITYVIDGVWEHNDGLNNGTVIFPGDIHRMSAGTGITHRESNHSTTEPAHLLQIWITPEKSGLVPGYEQRMFVPEESQGRLLLLASPDGRDNSVKVHQDIEIYLSTLRAGEEVRYRVRSGGSVRVRVVRGSLMMDAAELHGGDEADMGGGGELVLRGMNDAEVLVFDIG